ncbi:MAG: radical SAM protein [Candidatus Cloacimonetes bacterium]|nr:radical SAM protein [Candidatus Cloacimonadota bacterium]MDD4156678.1 radical SAM protein [Candidatus Cloacimonadota bacterium]
MIYILSRLIIYKLFYHIGFPKILPMNYTVSVTYTCNSRCKTCNIYNRKCKELSLEEYKKLSQNIGKSPYWITFSGGEPFLKRKFSSIVKLFYNNCKPKIINIPSNGIMTKKIVQEVKEICEHCKKSQIIINLSIDGIGEQHNQIRNVPDNYTKVINTYNQLKKLEYKNLSIGIHTVISKFNVDSFSSIANNLMSLKADQYITEIAEERNELITINSDISPDPIKYKSAVDFLIHRIKHLKITKKMHRITQSFRIEYYNLVKQILRDKTQVIPCYAGITSVQISPDGEVWACCIKAKSLGNLRKNNYNFKQIWTSKNFNVERKSIKNKECYCPLANASYTNMLLDFKILSRVFYRSFLKWWD